MENKQNVVANDEAIELVDETVDSVDSMSTGKKVGLGTLAVAGGALMVRGAVATFNDVKTKLIPGIKKKIEDGKIARAEKKAAKEAAKLEGTK